MKVGPELNRPGWGLDLARNRKAEYLKEVMVLAPIAVKKGLVTNLRAKIVDLLPCHKICRLWIQHNHVAT